MRLLSLALTLLVSGCSTTPRLTVADEARAKPDLSKVETAEADHEGDAPRKSTLGRHGRGFFSRQKILSPN